MTSQPVHTTPQRRECDHCALPAVFRIAVVAVHGETLEQLYYCTERFQEKVAEEPLRIAGVVNLAVDADLPLVP